jgi:hypothetical protein
VKSLSFLQGDLIEAINTTTKIWSLGRIIKVREEGTYDVLYENHDYDKHLLPELIKQRPHGQYHLQDRVLVNLQAISQWYAARITTIDSTADAAIQYSVVYDEERLSGESQVEESRIRAYGYGRGKFVEGSYVSVNKRNEGRYLSGRILAAHDDGSYDVIYDDHTLGREIRLLYDQILVREAPALITYQVDDLIEANYKGRGKWYSGKVLSYKRDEMSRLPIYLYHIAYDDGEEEHEVLADLIRYPHHHPVEVALQVSQETKLRVGDRVSANYKGHGRWYSGTIIKKRLDGRYDISYDDGGNEVSVAASHIKTIASETTEPSTPEDKEILHPETEMDVQEVVYEQGMSVEVNYKGLGQWYPGKIFKVRDDGAYNIIYDDGESEVRVHTDQIRPS